MPHIRVMFPKEYLAADDLRGRDVTLTITRIVQEGLRTESGTESKWVLYFKETEEQAKRDKNVPNRRLVANVTNAKTIAKLYGNETDDWIGKRITLFSTTCMAFGEQVDCIRVRPHAPTAKAKAKAPEPREEESADDLEDVPPVELGGIA